MNVGSPAEETEKRRKEGEERLAGGVRVRVIVSFFMINRTRTYYGRWPVPIKNSASSSDFTKRYTRERVYVHISVYEYLVPLKNLAPYIRVRANTMARMSSILIQNICCHLLPFLFRLPASLRRHLLSIIWQAGNRSRLSRSSLLRSRTACTDEWNDTGWKHHEM